ncbi:bifunctional DNA-formamidopyrimidine glycosylase/DNA-(apurinic or apyrimidinic site) lyase [Bacillus sp. REN16]|uniref:bifunctional DNA-formamidopyrimidine glycosylase/DNA-(apurinic or apyrimidinic site) lyase n=1 Tax=Bacillus sp. REN16 TaxID=2887296 RepID=UPI001E3186AC|nr:bifunctional DNA-formamidopyrimidine glycosylase/DNA-(apurinic or apyrimidinic site) lyase [Bacillus sp. REN16]MCC3357209.1 bifunctional DNA-formamidopyrimidine glycosylase/DNA-(apurinic or apyrimidinic site) lyase [Bacillus sp. REN16]
MPELPEMETYKNLLQLKIAGYTINSVEVNREKSINSSIAEFKNELIGNKITRIHRRAKQLIFDLSSGKKLLLHLMLGGLMYIETDDDTITRTKQVILSFGSHRLVFMGLRLGYLHLLTSKEVEEEFANLGPEPLQPNFTPQVFQKLAEHKKGKLKTTLVDQQFIAGIGNRYSDEICFAAELLPTRAFDSLDNSQLQKLHSSIQTVLQEGISHGGYIDLPLFRGDQLTGGFEERCRVYNREGEPCVRCGSVIVKKEVSSRKTFFCANCQI